MKRRILALGLVLVMALTVLCGCGNNTVVEENLDYEATVLTVGEEEVTLREAYFLFKWRQASYQAMASAQFGEEWYEQDLTGEGPFGDYIKESVIEELEQMYVIGQNAEKYNVSLTDEETAKIEEVVKEIMSSNNEAAQKAMGITEEIARKVVTNNTIYVKVYNEILKDVDTTVTKDEAAQKTYSYIYQQLVTYDEEGNEVDMTAEEQNNYYALFQTVKDEVEAGGSFDEVTEKYGLSPAEHSFGKQDDGSFNDINSIADELKVGEVSDLIPVEGGLFLLCLDSEYDEEATESARETMAYEILDEAYTEAYEAMKAEVTIELNEELWETVTFDQAVVAYVEE